MRGTFVEPWRKLPRIIGLYAVVWIVGATALTLARVFFDSSFVLQQVPNKRMTPAPTLDTKKVQHSLPVEMLDERGEPQAMEDRGPRSSTSQLAMDRERLTRPMERRLEQQEVDRRAEVQRDMEQRAAGLMLGGGFGVMKEILGNQARIDDAWDEARTSDDIGLLANFAMTYPNSKFANDAWNRIDILLNNGALQVASLENNVNLIALVLEHRKEKSSFLDNIITKHDLPNKYPYGYAIFYADGSKILSYGAPKNTLVRFFDAARNVENYVVITFDPSALGLAFKDNKNICISNFPVRINYRIPVNINNVCFGDARGSIANAARFGDLAVLKVEPLGTSQRGAAWVVGLRPALSIGPRVAPSP